MPQLQLKGTVSRHVSRTSVKYKINRGKILTPEFLLTRKCLVHYKINVTYLQLKVTRMEKD